MVCYKCVLGQGWPLWPGEVGVETGKESWVGVQMLRAPQALEAEYTRCGAALIQGVVRPDFWSDHNSATIGCTNVGEG